MKNLLKYKGYYALINCDVESGVLWGKIEGIDDLITFEGDTVQEAKEAFIDSVDDYISFCRKEGKTPEKPYSGVFNVRIDPELHKRLAEEATIQGKTLNAIVAVALRDFCDKCNDVDELKYENTKWRTSSPYNGTNNANIIPFTGQQQFKEGYAQ